MLTKKAPILLQNVDFKLKLTPFDKGNKNTMNSKSKIPLLEQRNMFVARIKIKWEEFYYFSLFFWIPFLLLRLSQ